MLSRSSSARSTSTSSSTSAFGSFASTSSSWSSHGAFDFLEPVESTVPHDIVDWSLKTPSRRAHASPVCSLASESRPSLYSFPRSHTTHAVCPKHGIVHDAALAIPERDSRSLSSSGRSSTFNSMSSCSSRGSTCSKRSLKCTLKRAMSFRRP
ncbi:hypothetical protein JCM9279_005971 [Rhodotorula babjevae]